MLRFARIFRQNLQRAFSPRRVLVGVLIALAVGAVLTDLTLPCVSNFWQAHPMLAAFGSGAVLIGLTALVVDALIRHAEARKWRGTALEAVETYLYVADSVTHELTEFIEASADQYSQPTGSTGDLRADLTRLIREHPGWVNELGEFVRQRADRAGEVALAATTALSLYPPLAGFVPRLNDLQRFLREIMDTCRGISFASGGRPVAEARPKLKPVIEEWSARIGNLIFERQDRILHLKLDLEEERRRSASPTSEE